MISKSIRNVETHPIYVERCSPLKVKNSCRRIEFSNDGVNEFKEDPLGWVTKLLRREEDITFKQKDV